MANRYLDKAVYIRETTNGKTKWVKIPGVTIQNGFLTSPLSPRRKLIPGTIQSSLRKRGEQNEQSHQGI